VMFPLKAKLPVATGAVGEAACGEAPGARA